MFLLNTRRGGGERHRQQQSSIRTAGACLSAQYVLFRDQPAAPALAPCSPLPPVSCVCRGANDRVRLPPLLFILGAAVFGIKNPGRQIPAALSIFSVFPGRRHSSGIDILFHHVASAGTGTGASMLCVVEH